MRGLVSVLAVLALAGLVLSGCGRGPARTGSPPAAAPGPAEFTVPGSSEHYLRALRTDQCALIDEALVGRLGWLLTSQSAQTLVSCGAASEDLKQSLSIETDIVATEREAPASGTSCYRLKIIDPVSNAAVKAVVTAADDPCGRAEQFAATAAARFDAGAGRVQPPNPWIALDACELLRLALPGSAPVLGGPKQTSTQLRRVTLRGCLASHQHGTVELSVTPAAGRPGDLDGDQAAVAGMAARVQQLAGSCRLLVVGDQLGGNGKLTETQVITFTVAADEAATAEPCALARTIAEQVAGAAWVIRRSGDRADRTSSRPAGRSGGVR